MRRKLLAVVSGFVLLACCCIGVVIFGDGYFLPSKPCRPLTYPDGQRTADKLTITTADAIDNVLQFFDEKLKVQPYPSDIGQWQRQKIDETSYLYTCYATDINLSTTETGCIYVSAEGANTYIETELLRSEGGNNQCSRFKP